MISVLNRKEIQPIIEFLSRILDSDGIHQVFKNRKIAMISAKREELYLIENKDQSLIEQINSISTRINCIPEYIKIKLGFLIKGEFKIGIESLALLAPYAQEPFILTTKQTNLFIYGKSFPIHDNIEKKERKRLEEGQIVIVFEKTMIPLGYGKLVKKSNIMYLENLVDIGIYLRSEKSAF